MIRHKLFALAGAGTLTTVIMALIGFWGISTLTTQLSDNTVIASALRNHLQADMMHDARSATRARPVGRVNPDLNARNGFLTADYRTANETPRLNPGRCYTFPIRTIAEAAEFKTKLTVIAYSSLVK